MTNQLKNIEILNPSKSATCSMWRYPESAKIFQYRGMDFDGFRVVRVNGCIDGYSRQILWLEAALTNNDPGGWRYCGIFHGNCEKQSRLSLTTSGRRWNRKQFHSTDATVLEKKLSRCICRGEELLRGKQSEQPAFELSKIKITALENIITCS